MARRLSIIGGGPAGLRAAEIASTGGCEVTLFDGKPSVGRKFLVAGKGGLNLTHGEPLEKFTTRYSGPADFWEKVIGAFSPADLREWAAELGVETFQATSGRVYPKALKAAPLLRRWIARLKENGVRLEMNHRLVGVGQAFLPDMQKESQTGMSDLPYTLRFANGTTHETDAIILAMGGASWPQTGSDGAWSSFLADLGIAVKPLAPANCGWELAWPEEIIPAIEGQPLKNIHASADGKPAIGELMLTRYGVEGGAIYQLGATLRAMEEPAITIDFKPTFTESSLIAKMESVKRNFLAEAKVRWKLPEPAIALLSLRHHPDIPALAAAVKHFRIPLTRPRPIGEAISSAGGVAWDEIDGNLMLRKAPGIFVAGEMIDWEAPTGGYLMQGCFATGTRAAIAAGDWLKQR